mmetsp:Transcript_45868/g.68276  ORF Transcript_45868/g.68276 Transcript_45868/m.68276 type:complete len:80 (-) Transcript_45868:922-1161(-)
MSTDCIVAQRFTSCNVLGQLGCPRMGLLGRPGGRCMELTAPQLAIPDKADLARNIPECQGQNRLFVKSDGTKSDRVDCP